MAGIPRWAVTFQGDVGNFYPRLATVEVAAETAQAAALSVVLHDLGHGGTFFVTELPEPIYVGFQVKP